MSVADPAREFSERRRHVNEEISVLEMRF